MRIHTSPQCCPSGSAAALPPPVLTNAQPCGASPALLHARCCSTSPVQHCSVLSPHHTEQCRKVASAPIDASHDSHVARLQPLTGLLLAAGAAGTAGHGHCSATSMQLAPLRSLGAMATSRTLHFARRTMALSAHTAPLAAASGPLAPLPRAPNTLKRPHGLARKCQCFSQAARPRHPAKKGRKRRKKLGGPGPMWESTFPDRSSPVHTIPAQNGSGHPASPLQDDW
jgi:hypothetical protein